jgi:hypothetical protein
MILKTSSSSYFFVYSGLIFPFLSIVNNDIGENCSPNTLTNIEPPSKKAIISSSLGLNATRINAYPSSVTLSLQAKSYIALQSYY